MYPGATARLAMGVTQSITPRLISAEKDARTKVVYLRQYAVLLYEYNDGSKLKDTSCNKVQMKRRRKPHPLPI